MISLRVSSGPLVMERLFILYLSPFSTELFLLLWKGAGRGGACSLSLEKSYFPNLAGLFEYALVSLFLLFLKSL